MPGRFTAGLAALYIASPRTKARAMDGEDSATALTRTLEIRNRRGLHARAAAKLVTQAERYGADVTVVKLSGAEPEGEAVSARSIMGLMMLGAGIGSHIVLRAEGWDAKEALDALAALIEAGFHEQD